jgi:hypothetical protein
MVDIYGTFDFKKDKTCPITLEDGNTLVRTGIIQWNDIPEEKKKNLKKQYNYLENVKIEDINLIYFINIHITKEISELKKCFKTRRYYSQAEQNRLKFKYSVNEVKKEDYNKFKLDTNGKKIKINFDNIKISDDNKILENIFKKFMKIEDLVNFYNPYEKIKKDNKKNDTYNWAIRNYDKQLCKEKNFKWVVRKSNTFKTTEFMYDEDKNTFMEAQKKYTIYIPKLKSWVFIIYDMGKGYTLYNKFSTKYKENYTNLYDCLQNIIKKFVKD